MKTVVIIPARMASKRLPGKPLLEAGGKALVRHTWEAARKTKAAHIVVATPDREIAKYCDTKGMIWAPTREDHPTGTHRCAEVAERFKPDANVEIVVNWQVDEPLVNPESVNELIHKIEVHSTIATLIGPLDLMKDDPNTIKAAVSEHGRALWFSRANLLGAHAHIGVYAFEMASLRRISALSPTYLSQQESLEQLIWLEAIERIDTVWTNEPVRGINTQEDWEWFRQKTEVDNNVN
jgi:3-deoxy-manno-octulosonate cytidylyltransferase (CMP-KDO synthetase)